MDDEKIVELYWLRSSAAIEETEKKYGAYLNTVAFNILGNAQDAEECVNDTYVGAWNSMPDKRPKRLSPYLGRIARNRAIDRAIADTRQKRGGGEVMLALDELGDVTGGVSAERELERRELARTLNTFLSTLSGDERRVFVARYFFIAPVDEIAAKFGFTRSKTASMLLRTRKKLRTALEKEGYV